MGKKRPLRERGSAEERKAAHTEAEALESTEIITSETIKKQKTEADRKRWTLPVEPKLCPLPNPGTDIISTEDEQTTGKVLQDCLGFTEFGSTKGLHVFGNQDGPLPPKRKRRQYRQMLHVKGIYDVPLTRDQLSNKE